MSGPFRPRRVGAVLTVAGLLTATVAACGPKQTRESPPSSPTSSPSASRSASPSPSGPPSTSPSPSGGNGQATPPPASSPPAAGTVTHRGTVERGVEPGCLILHSPDGTFELIGGDRTTLTEGSNVVVQGYPEKGMMSHCMQGTMFKVVSAYKANQAGTGAYRLESRREHVS